MIYLFPSGDKHKPRSPITLEIGEVREYDFSDAADQIYHILSVLQMPYAASENVFDAIHDLVDDIDLGSDELQISEFRHIRVEFRDEMLALEVFVGV